MQNVDLFGWGNASDSSATIHSVAGEPKAKRPKLQSQGAPSLNTVARLTKLNHSESPEMSQEDESDLPGSVIEVDTGHGIKGTIGVQFPYEPYPIQQKFVETLVKCLDSGGNALLESPTGTGKTACLLCGSISWQKQYSDSVKSSDVHMLASSGTRPSIQGSLFDKQKLLPNATAPDQGPGGNRSLKPKILYSSRTHSQLSQAIGELKKATTRGRYKGVKAVVIGSRDQLCLHPEVKQEANSTVKTHMCRQKVRNGLCSFYNNFEKVKDGRKVIRNVNDSASSKTGEKPFGSSLGFEGGKSGGGSCSSEIMDIEDLVKMGINESVCPYYYSREMSSTRADVIFMPYNYIIDPHTRKSHNVELTDNVVIFDEGHNIDSLCEESASFSLSSLEVASAFKETQKLLEKMAEAEKKFQGKENENVSGMNESSDIYLGDESLTPDFNMNDAAVAASIFHKLETILLDVHVKSEAEGTVFKGSTIYTWLEDAGLARDKTAAIISTVDQIASFLSGQQLANSFQVRPYGIMKMAEVLKQLYPDMGQDDYATFFLRNSSRTEFKMHLTVMSEKDHKNSGSGGGSASSDPWASKKNASNSDSSEKGGTSSSGASNEVKPRVLNYWCFSPAYAMKSVLQQRTRSVIITSGTLSPLASFELEMRTRFPWQLQNPHIVSPAQFFVAVVNSGPLGSKLSSAYSNRSSIDYLNDLGAFIANMSKLVPHGMLVFFPSYIVMTNCVEKWKQTETWKRITHFKPVYIEPRDKSALADVMGQYTMDVRSRPDNKGAAFFAVCRGKVSEGLDFADINGRAVIITGLPYPPQMDPRVKLKMQYLDDSSKAKPTLVQPNRSTPVITSQGGCSGSKIETQSAHQSFDGKTWYQQQAVRAVNQAIGRVLRHKNDYGAILLCDERFSYSNNLSHLSSWIKPSVRHYRNFNTLPKDLTSFYRVASMKYPYEETSSSVLPSAPDLKRPSPVKRNALTGNLEPRPPRPGIKKSNVVTHHIQKPDWISNQPIPHALKSTYMSQKESTLSCLNAGRSENSLFNRLLTFDDETQHPPADLNQSNDHSLSASQITSAQSQNKRKKIRLKGNIGLEGRDFVTPTLSTTTAETKNADETQKVADLNGLKQKQEVSAVTTTAKDMFETAQKVLSALDLTAFKRLIWRYRKEDASFGDMSTFIHCKLSTGISHDKEKHQLRNMLRKYVKTKHLEEYEELCEKMNR